MVSPSRGELVRRPSLRTLPWASPGGEPENPEKAPESCAARPLCGLADGPYIEHSRPYVPCCL